jgi:hypothetical protein
MSATPIVDHLGAYMRGKSVERSFWLPLADALETLFRNAPADADGSVVLTMEQRLQLSIALERAKRR